jgi:hypothetical protein
MDLKQPEIDLYYCPSVSAWVADFVGDLAREYLYGTTEVVMAWINPDDLEQAVEYLQAHYPERVVRVRNTRQVVRHDVV